MVRLYVDDIREAPPGWHLVMTSEQAIKILDTARKRGELVHEMSLDHDLGGDDTTRPIVMWCCENQYWPLRVNVHSANPVGIEWLEGMVERYWERPFTSDTPGLTDKDGVVWYACDPYPTWYRWEGKKLLTTRRPQV